MNAELLHKPYRNKLRKIIITYPQIDGANPLFYLCIELINVSHKSAITLEELAGELVGIVAEYRKQILSKGNSAQQLTLLKQAILNWLRDEKAQVAIPLELLNTLSTTGNTEQELDEKQKFIIQLERIKKATVEHQHVLNNRYQANQKLVALLDNYLLNRKKLVCDNKIKEYKNTYLPFFQKSYQQKEETIEALKTALEGNSVDLKKYLSILRNGTLSRELNEFVKSGQANILVNKQKVYTVADFIRALDAQVNSEVGLAFKA